MRNVLLNTASKFKIFMSDAANPLRGKTGLLQAAFTVHLAKTGFAEAIVTPTIVERGQGWYEVTPTTAERNTLGESAWTFAAVDAVDCPQIENVVQFETSSIMDSPLFEYWKYSFIIQSFAGYTLLGSEDYDRFVGIGEADMLLNGQDMQGLEFINLRVSGAGVISAFQSTFRDCYILANSSLGPFRAYRTGFDGVTNLSSQTAATDIGCYLTDCFSSPPDQDEYAEPMFDFTACTKHMKLSSRRWSGGLKLNGMKSYGGGMRDIAIIDGITGGELTILNLAGGIVMFHSAGNDGVIIDASCTSGAVVISGNPGTIVDNSSGAVTVIFTNAIINRLLDEGGGGGPSVDFSRTEVHTAALWESNPTTSTFHDIYARVYGPDNTLIDTDTLTIPYEVEGNISGVLFSGTLVRTATGMYATSYELPAATPSQEILLYLAPMIGGVAKLKTHIVPVVNAATGGGSGECGDALLSNQELMIGTLDDISSRIPDALENGRMKAVVEPDPNAPTLANQELALDALAQGLAGQADISSRIPDELENGRMKAVTEGESIPAPIVERSTADTNALTFVWPTLGATITGEVSKNNDPYVPVTGAITFLRTESGKHYYTLAYDPADRLTEEGQVRYAFTDGTYTRYVNMRIYSDVQSDLGAALDEDTYPELPAVPPAETTIRQMIQYTFMRNRNKSIQSTTERIMYADDDATPVATEQTEDNGTTYTKGKAE